MGNLPGDAAFLPEFNVWQKDSAETKPFVASNLMTNLPSHFWADTKFKVQTDFQLSTF